MLRDYYDRIACKYDQDIKEDIRTKTFPYAVYDEVQDIIASYIQETFHEEKVNILDIGIGTASLYEKLLPDRIAVTGIDFSKQMLEVARLRLPEATLYLHDILKGLPEETGDQSYDFIVINYVFKHFDIKTVIQLVNLLKPKLARFGKIFISGIMFLDDVYKNICLSRHPEYKDLEYHYHLYQQFVKKLDDDLALSFMEINEYTGIVIIENYYDNTLQFEETLVKYKSNTVKWKSSHPQKNRE